MLGAVRVARAFRESRIVQTYQLWAGFRRLDAESNLTAEPLFRACRFETTGSRELATPDGATLPVVRMTKALDDRRRYNVPRA